MLTRRFAVLGLWVLGFFAVGHVYAACQNTPGAIGVAGLQQGAYTCDDTANFSSSGQNIWGPGNTRPKDATVSIEQRSFNLSAGGREIKNIPPFGDFGGAVNARIVGNYGIYFGIQGLSGGTVDVSYRLGNQVSGPSLKDFRPGERVAVAFTSVTDDATLTGSGQATAGEVSAWIDFDAKLSIGATGCAFGCETLNLPSIGVNSKDVSGLPAPPGLQGPFGRDKLTLFRLPVGVGNFAAGPLGETFFDFFQGECDAGEISVREFGRIYDKSGLEGCFGFPKLVGAGVSAFDQDALVASSRDRFIKLGLDLDFWASKIRFVPPLSYSKTVLDAKVVTARVFADLLDVDVVGEMKLNQQLTLTPRPSVTLTFPMPIDYDVFRSGSPVRTGTAASITLNEQETLYFAAPASTFQIQTEYHFPNTFENQTNIVFDRTLEEKIAEAGFIMNSVTLGFGPRICKPWPGYGCWSPAIGSGGFDVGVGPLKEFSQNLGEYQTRVQMDSNRSRWNLGGFNTVAGSALQVDPAYPPVVVLTNPPLTANEGDTLVIDASASSDPDSGFSLSAVSHPQWHGAVGDTAGVLEVVVEDNALHTVSVSAEDLLLTFEETARSAPEITTERFRVAVANVAPVLQLAATAAANEGDVVSLTVTVTDVGIHDTQTGSIQWGDGTSEPYAMGGGGGIVNRTHVYADQGTYTIDVCVTDKDGATVCDSRDTIISNANPDILSVDFAILERPELVDNAGTLESRLHVDVPILNTFNEPGTLDTHTARIVLDNDGSEQPLTVRWMPGGPPGYAGGLNGEFFADLGDLSYDFTAAGNYTTQVCITDDDGGEDCEPGPTLDIDDFDLVLGGSTTPVTAPIGDALTYTYTLTNNGPDTAENVAVTIDLPEVAGAEATTLLSAKQGMMGQVEQRILPSDVVRLAGFPAGFDPNFGRTISAAGDTLVIGAPGADSMYIFQRVADQWIQTALISEPPGCTGFGAPVVVSPDQSTIMVGALSATFSDVVLVYRRQDLNGTPGDLADDTWKLEPGSAGNELTTDGAFGSPSNLGLLGMALEGDTLVIGQSRETVAMNTNAGSLYVYVRDDNGTPADFSDDRWNLEQRIEETMPAANRRFGAEVVIEDGRIVASAGPEVVVLENMAGWQVVQTVTGADLDDVTGVRQINGLALDNSRLMLLSSETTGQDDRVISFVHDGNAFVREMSMPTIASAGIQLEGDYAAFGSLTFLPATPGGAPQVVGAIRTLEHDGRQWQPEGVLIPSQAAERESSFANDAVALTGRTIIGGNPDSTQLGKAGLGMAISMVTCEERPTGRVICGLGAIASGASRAVELITRVACGVGSGNLIEANAITIGNGVDSVPADNALGLTTATTALLGNECSVDVTPPLITPLIAATLGNDAWYTTDVALTWDVQEPDSSIQSSAGCGPTNLTTDTDADGIDYLCSATSDVPAPNEDSSTVSINIRRDATAPTLDAMTTGTAGDNGWFLDDVTIDYTCTESSTGSGLVSCPTQRVVTAEGITPNIRGETSDVAGNTRSVSQTVMIDRTAPTIVANRTPANANGWNNTDVTVDFTCADQPSGVASCSPSEAFSNEGVGFTSTGSVTDVAGRTAETVVADIRIDRTSPTLDATFAEAPNGAGWYRLPTSASFSCTDGLSGVAVCPEPIVLDTEGLMQSATVTATDVANNETELTITANIDATAPVIGATITPAADLNGLRAAPVTVTFDCSDALSGIATCSDPVILEQPGLDFEVSGQASDAAGNIAEATVTSINVGQPALTLLVTDQMVLEGDMLSMDLARVTAPIHTTGLAVVDWGDGAKSEVAFTPDGFDGLINAPYAYADDGVYTATVTVETIFGTLIEDSFQVIVDNADPVFDRISLGKGAVPTFEVRIDQGIVLDIAFTDPGSADTHLVTIDWGDGTVVSDYEPNETPLGPPSPGLMSGHIQAGHQFAATGMFLGEICLGDDDGAEVCTPVQFDVVTVPTVPELTCAIDFGAPVDQGTDTLVKLFSTVEAGGTDPITNVIINWGDADDDLPFDDRTLRDPTLTLSSVSTVDQNLGVNFGAVVDFASGGTNTCVATGCAILRPDGVLAPCDLIIGDDAFADLTLAVSGPASVTPGSLLIYTLLTSNAGTIPANDVVLTETVPVGTVFDAAGSTAGWTCAGGAVPGTDCDFTVGAILSGESASVTFAVTVDPAPVGAGFESIDNAASLVAVDENAVALQAADTTTTALDAAPDLTLALTLENVIPIGVAAPAGQLRPGDRFTVDVGYANAGSQNATGVEVAVSFPAGVEFDAGLSSPGWVCVTSPQQCTRSVGDFATGATGTSTLGFKLTGDNISVLLNGTVADDGMSGADSNALDNVASLEIPVDRPCVEGLNVACLLDGRFRVTVDFDAAGGSFVPPGSEAAAGMALASRFSDDTALISFFEPVQIDLFVHLVDACGFGGRYWVFAGPATDAEFEITVTDTQQGVTRTYFSPAGGPISAVADTDAFATCPAGKVAEQGLPIVGLKGTPGTCGGALCLVGDRFALDVRWENPATLDQGSASALLETGQSSFASLFGNGVGELLVTLIDNGSGSFWLGAGSATNVALTMEVTDTQTGIVTTYARPAGQFQSVFDLSQPVTAMLEPDPGGALPGGATSFVLTVRNDGPQSRSYSATITTPMQTSNPRFTCNGAPCAPIGVLAPGASETYLYTVDVDQGASFAAELAAQASVETAATALTRAATVTVTASQQIGGQAAVEVMPPNGVTLDLGLIRAGETASEDVVFAETNGQGEGFTVTQCAFDDGANLMLSATSVNVASSASGTLTVTAAAGLVSDTLRCRITANGAESTYALELVARGEAVVAAMPAAGAIVDLGLIRDGETASQDVVFMETSGQGEGFTVTQCSLDGGANVTLSTTSLSVATGGSGTLTVTATAGFLSDTLRCRITANGVESTYTLDLEARGDAAFATTPASGSTVDLGLIRDGETASQDVVFTETSGQGESLTVTQCAFDGGANMTLSTTSLSVATGGSGILTVIASAGFLADTLRCRITGSGVESTYTLDFEARGEAVFAVTPANGSTVELGVIEAGASQALEVTFSEASDRGTGFEVRDCQLVRGDFAELSGSALSVDAGGAETLIVTARSGLLGDTLRCRVGLADGDIVYELRIVALLAPLAVPGLQTSMIVLLILLVGAFALRRGRRAR